VASKVTLHGLFAQTRLPLRSRLQVCLHKHKHLNPLTPCAKIR